MVENPNNKQVALSSVESKYTSSFVGKTNYIDLNGLFARMVDKKEMNERYKLENGYLTYELQIQYNNMDLEIQNLTNLQKYLDLYAIPFAYVQTPHVIPTDDDPMIPMGYETNINGNSDRLLLGLEENDIVYLDLRDKIVQDEINNYELFFATDHHWNIQGAYWAHEHVALFIDQILNKNLVTSEYFDLISYSTEFYNNIFLGSDGQRTGLFFGGVDDVTLIIPSFATNFTVEIPNHQWDRIGTFDETILERSYLENQNLNYFSKNTYKVYLELNTEYIKIKNNLATNDTKVLLIKDSFSKPLAAYLALHYSEVHLYQVGSQETLLEKLHEIQPDIVLQVRTSTNSLTEEALNMIK